MLGCELDADELPELAQHLRGLGARVTRVAGNFTSASWLGSGACATM
jgi:hypothetical protein